VTLHLTITVLDHENKTVAYEYESHGSWADFLIDLRNVRDDFGDNNAKEISDAED
jgi:hypothetical protein